MDFSNPRRRLCFIFLFVFVSFLPCAYAEKIKFKNPAPKLKIIGTGVVVDKKSADKGNFGIADFDFKEDGLMKVWVLSAAAKDLIGVVDNKAEARVRGIYYVDFIITGDLPEGSTIKGTLLVPNECYGYINTAHFSKSNTKYYAKYNIGLLVDKFGLTDWDRPALGKTIFFKSDDGSPPEEWGTDLALSLSSEGAQFVLGELFEHALVAAGTTAASATVIGAVVDVAIKVIEFAIDYNNFVNDANQLDESISGSDIVEFNDISLQVSGEKSRRVYRAYASLDIKTVSEKWKLEQTGACWAYADFFNHPPHYGDNDGKILPKRGFRIKDVYLNYDISSIKLPEHYSYPRIEALELRRFDDAKPLRLGEKETLTLKVINRGKNKPFKLVVRPLNSHQPPFTVELGKDTYGPEYLYNFDYAFDRLGENKFRVELDPAGDLDPYIDLAYDKDFSIDIKPAADLKVELTDILGDVEINKEVQVRARVTNLGTIASASTDIALYAKGYLVEKKKITAVAPNGYEDVIFKWVPRQEGEFDLICDVDMDKKMVEYATENNRSRMKVNIQLPKHQWLIQEKSLICVPDKPEAGENAKIYFTVKNKGYTADTLGYDVYVDGKKIKSGSVIVSPGEVKTVGNASQDEITWKASGGRHVVKLVLDPMYRFSDFARAAAVQELVVSSNVPMPAVEGVDLVLEQKEIHKDGDKLSFRVYNRGTKPWCCTDIYVNQYTSGREKPSLAEKLYRSFAPQSYENFSILLPPNAGESKFEIVVDPLKAIAEVDENNNAATYTFPGYRPYRPPEVTPRAKGPDLIVVGAANLDTPLEVGGKRQVEISIANQNLMDAGRVQVDYAFRNLDTKDRNPAHGYFEGKEILEGVRAEEKRAFNVDYPVVYPGNYELNVWIDQAHLVPETDEMNNSFRQYFTVGGQVTAASFFADKNADLAIDNDVEVSNLQPNAGMKVNFKVTARNNSDIVIWGADLDMFINDKLESGEPLGDFPAHSEKTFTFNHTFLASGDYTVKFMVDAKKAVPETNEENNTAIVNIEVTRGILGTGHSDAAITGFSLSKTTCFQGELITATATVKNTGQDVLRGFLATIGPAHKQPVYVKIIPILDPAGEIVISTTLPALIAGTHLIEARVDGPNTIREDNEDNNVQTINLRVEPWSKEKAAAGAAGVAVEKAGSVLDTIDSWLRGLGKPKK